MSGAAMALGICRRPVAAPAPLRSAPEGRLLQRKSSSGGRDASDGECEECKKKELQAKASGQRSQGTAGFAPPIVESVLRAPGHPLNPESRAFMEPRFQRDFGHVRVHADSRAAESARAVGALAYTVGRDIVLGSGHQDPQSPSGRRLLAHELAHVVQQQGGRSRSGLSGGMPEVSPAEQRAPRASGEDVAPDSAASGRTPLARGGPGDVREREADSVASEVVEGPAGGRLPKASPSGTAPLLQRQPGTPQTQPPKVVQPVAPNSQQKDMIEKARAAAAVRAQIALMQVRGITPPAPRSRDPDPSKASMSRARRLAQVLFQWDNPNMDQVESVVSHMVSTLSNPSVMVAGPKDPECGTRDGYVRGLRPPIVLCPLFFSGSAEQRTRTLIHESAHLAGIGSADAAETYLPIWDCKTPGGFDSADAWGQYVNCLSGQAADQPETIEADPAKPRG
jgi:hypothetical protein